MPSRIAADLAQLARLASDGGLDLRQVALRVKADLLLSTANPPSEDMEAFRDMAAALIPVIEGAGGLITDWDGRPLTPASDGRVIAAATPKLLEETLARLHGGAA